MDRTEQKEIHSIALMKFREKSIKTEETQKKSLNAQLPNSCSD